MAGNDRIDMTATISRRGLTVRLAALAGGAVLGARGVKAADARTRENPWSPAGGGGLSASGAGSDASGSNATGSSQTGWGSTGSTGSNASGTSGGTSTTGQSVTGSNATGQSATGTNGGPGQNATGQSSTGTNSVVVVKGDTNIGQSVTNDSVQGASILSRIGLILLGR